MRGSYNGRARTGVDDESVCGENNEENRNPQLPPVPDEGSEVAHNYLDATGSREAHTRQGMIGSCNQLVKAMGKELRNWG